MSYTNGLDNPELYFQCKLYTGTGSSLAVTLDGSEDMQPDFLWGKCRGSGETNKRHVLTDSVRGINKQLASNTTAAETSYTNSFTAFGSNGFSVGNDNGVNESSNTHVAWCWKESATAGFDIVSYTGNGSNRTISHSLSAVPTMMIHKSRDNATYQWGVYTKALGNQKNLNLNTNAAANSDSGGVYYNSTTPTSSVFSLGTNVGYNKSSDNYIAYLFADKQGFSKCGGSYTGNGNVDGAYVYLGFAPQFLLIRGDTTNREWILTDFTRQNYNDGSTPTVWTNLSNAEGNYAIDYLSNGFKIRTTSASLNASGNTYIYMCFAEAPLVNSKGVPCNAR